MNEVSSKFKGQVLRQVYRVWLFRRLLPVLVAEVAVLAFLLWQLGRVVFFQRIFENALNIFFLSPSQIVPFTVSAFTQAAWATRILSFGALVLIALVLRHLTQGILRLILVKENYFGKISRN